MRNLRRAFAQKVNSASGPMRTPSEVSGATTLKGSPSSSTGARCMQKLVGEEKFTTMQFECREAHVVQRRGELAEPANRVEERRR